MLALLTRALFATITTDRHHRSLLPCIKAPGQAFKFVNAADTLACLKSLPFNETLKRTERLVSSVGRL